MLKLKRVELQGFKSFCDRTELRFQGDGIAAVVGPNGCGKSNLSDAISWVLGEQSAKSLRGSRMEDVIFAGTRDRKPVGMAAVTMTLLDPGAKMPEVISINGENGHNGHNGHANGFPQKPSEITITRRLFRSGESEYLIGGRPARLRDIQDLFMGSGLGPESYAIIEQGRIGQILSSKPQDRRAVIEEAAGITKYKSRKRLAEAKLESAKQNLSRVFDILEEVTRQVNSLKRQAAKAKRYTELKQELDERLRALLAGRSRVLRHETRNASAQLEQASAELREAAGLADASERERESVQAVCYQIEEQLTALRAQLAATNVDAERTRGRLESQVRESGSIEQRLNRGEQEIQDLDTRLGQCSSERETLGKSVADVETRIAAARAQMTEKNQSRDRIQNSLREQEKTIEANRLQILRLLGEASTLKNQLAQINEFLAGIDRETVRAQKEEQGATVEIERIAGARKKLSEAMASRQLELQSVTGDRKTTETDLAENKKRAGELRGRVDQLRGETSKLRAQKDSLDNILAHHSYTTESVKRLFGAVDRKQAGDFQPLGVLADFVEVDSTFERAAEEFLHEELEYVVVEDWAQAERGMSLLRNDLEGRATFLIEESRATPEELPSVEAGVGASGPALPRLSEHLRLTNGLTGQSVNLLPRLSRCYVAEDAESARRFALDHPRLFFLLPDGLCYHGQTLSGGKKKASGPLALKRELRELATTLKERDRELAAQVSTQEKLTQAVAALENNLERLRALQQSQEKDVLALDHEMRKLTDETNRGNSRVSVARLEIERLRRERERAITQRDNNLAAIERKDGERGEREASLEAAREDLRTAEAEASRVGEEHSALRAELASFEERQRAERSAFSRLDIQFRDMSGRRQAIGQETERLGAHRSRLLSENIELDRKSGELKEQVIQLEAKVLSLAGDEAGRRESLRVVDEQLKELRGRIEAGHQKRSELEVELVRRQSELKFLDETSRKELNCSLADCAEGAELPDSAALAEAERLYQESKSRIEALGPINSQALEEYQEAQQRQEFLGAQRQDLIDSIRDTEKAIQEIDVVSRHKFNEAFEAINANFKKCFETLFGGGSGEMRLTDEANSLESGIDIVASPPGKKLQNVLLLSGGEKALAALSLLMAIFRYQPSPFCILDEVDAPLDEANIGRLTRLLREMAVDTQFIIITHSKKTMESAESMYGVTMQEAGVSKLVSVKFHGTNSREAVPA
ncbi:MAG: chromosome segregation protein SMC [Acidobacteriota bacterium]|nr:chromosome segregation protein SMC [Acidobacteriota bacterium]